MESRLLQAITLLGGLYTSCVIAHDADSKRCMICDDTQRTFTDYEDFTVNFNVVKFQGTGDFDFFISVEIEHEWLQDLLIEIQQDGGNAVEIWDNECDGWEDLSAVFYDGGSDTVAGQSECYQSEITTIYARGHELFSSQDIGGSTKTGVYTLTFYDQYSGETGQLNQVCIGWLSESDDCNVSDELDSCEVCSEPSVSTVNDAQISQLIAVWDFDIAGGGSSEFYVKVQIDHRHLRDLIISLSERDGNAVLLMDQECSSSDDLYAVFYDSAIEGSISDQDSCDSDIDTLIYATPNQDLADENIGASNGNSYYNLTISDSGTSFTGTLLKWCVGYFTNTNCTIDGGTVIPTVSPTSSPTQYPTKAPTVYPTDNPTQSPTEYPTRTRDPTTSPTSATDSPTMNPTLNPTQYPTKEPTGMPTTQPTSVTGMPTVNPTEFPTRTRDPTMAPTMETGHPTTDPTMATNNPSVSPTMATDTPSMNPTSSTDIPTISPTHDTDNPTVSPTLSTDGPTVSPTESTDDPTMSPTSVTVDPTTHPTKFTEHPTMSPSMSTEHPTGSPTASTGDPSVSPTISTMNPSIQPTINPTMDPTMNPTPVDLDVTTTQVSNDDSISFAPPKKASSLFFICMALVSLIHFF